MINHHNTKLKKSRDFYSKDNLIRLFFIVIIVISLGIMIGVISYTIYTVNNNNNNIITQSVLDTYVEVVNYNILGLNGDTDAVRFGIITAGNHGKRFLNISSKEKAKVNIYVSGDMASYISVEKNDFFLEEGVSELVPVNLYIPKNTTPGNYSGKIYITLTRH